MPLQATSGAASYDAFGGGVAAVPNYIEQIFSTYLYTGTGAAQTITNGIDLAGKGGLVWMKDRGSNPSYQFNVLMDTARPSGGLLISNATDAESGGTLTTYNTDGFRINAGYTAWNSAGQNYASWTFRKQPKFFDVVTYTGDGTAGRTVAHNLGSVPGCIIVKKTSTGDDWAVYHRSLGATQFLLLNDTLSAGTSSNYWNNTTPTSTQFTLGAIGTTNASGSTYVAYLFAHNAGGFGLTGTDNVISCGSYTGDDSDNGSKQVNLGFEPQWVLIKSRTDAQNWFLVDNMRGMTANGSCNHLRPNLSGEEQELALIAPTATGFNLRNAAINTSGSTYIYIAIRRGPMKVPTSGTSVFVPNTYTGSGSSQSVTTNFPVDLNITKRRTAVSPIQVTDRLRGSSTTYYNYLRTNATDAETTGSTYGFGLDNNTAYVDNLFSTFNSGSDIIGWNWRRAPSFFDEVCYTGTGSAMTVAHNLTVVPELMIVKSRSTSDAWPVYSAATGNSQNLFLNQTDAAASRIYWNNTTPTSSVFSLGNSSVVSNSGTTYVAYLFATCAGVSKCTAFTGTGTLQTIDCGFTSGSRFVLIKRTDAAGDWYVWDSSRGLSSSTDPYLLLNSTAAEVTSTNWVDTTATGFQVTAASGNNVNINGASYIALAIA